VHVDSHRSQRALHHGLHQLCVPALCALRGSSRIAGSCLNPAGNQYLGGGACDAPRLSLSAGTRRSERAGRDLRGDAATWKAWYLVECGYMPLPDLGGTASRRPPRTQSHFAGSHQGRCLGGLPGAGAAWLASEPTARYGILQLWAVAPPHNSPTDARPCPRTANLRKVIVLVAAASVSAAPGSCACLRFGTCHANLRRCHSLFLPDDADNYNYGGAGWGISTAPDFFGASASLCATGQNQSPINIATAATTTKTTALPALNLAYSNTIDWTFVATGALAA